MIQTNPSHKKMKTLCATWLAYTHFDIPDDVAEYLQPKPYGANLQAVGRWYIRWNTLYYNDKEGREKEIQGCNLQCEMKVPEKIEDAETDDVLYEDKY
jgi:hypothetical protein